MYNETISYLAHAVHDLKLVYQKTPNALKELQVVLNSILDQKPSQASQDFEPSQKELDKLSRLNEKTSSLKKRMEACAGAVLLALIKLENEMKNGV